MKRLVLIAALFSFSAMAAKAQDPCPFRGGYENLDKVEKDMTKGKSKKLDKYIENGLNPNCKINGGFDLLKMSSYWETSFPSNNIGFESFRKIAELPHANLEVDGGLGKTAIFTAAESCSIQTAKYLISRGVNFKKIIITDYGPATVLTNIMMNDELKTCSNVQMIEIIQYLIDQGVGLCDDDGDWLSPIGMDKSRIEVANHFFYKYETQMYREGDIRPCKKLR